MSSNSNKRNNAAGRRAQRRAAAMATAIVPRSVRPPPFDPNTPIRRRMRYYFNATPSSISPINAATLVESFGAHVTTLNSAATPLFGWIRIKSIEVWGQPFQAGQVGQSTVAVVWGYQNSMNTPSFSANRELQDTSTSPTYVPYIKAVPPAGSNASMWQGRLDATGVRRTGGANVIFSILGNQNTIVDIDADLVTYDAGKSTAVPTFTITSGVLTAFAYAALDGVGGQIAPQSVDQFT